MLGIESSCDETAASVVAGGRRVLSNIIASQIALHQRYGGVVPEIASRKHLENVIPTIQEALDSAGVTLDEVDTIAGNRRPWSGRNASGGVERSEGAGVEPG